MCHAKETDMKKGTNTVKKCAACGREFEPGKRVRVIFRWESVVPWRHSDGTSGTHIGKASASRMVCKPCAYAALEVLGMERP